jgi:putative endonuclease
VAQDPRRAFGRAGEAEAARFLEALGYRVLARNVRAGGVELDLVVCRGGLVAFVEVKARRGSGHGPPEEAVDARKRERLVRGAAAWLAEQPRRYARTRFDVVACEREGGAWRVRHWPGGFDAGD